MRHIVIGTAGHIDHGKSTLVQALTGIDPDRLKEEKARGITIDLGFAHCRIGETRIAFVDVPGHERFVRNMLAGATGIDAVLLVVSADESVMPQTREHFAICRLLDVRAGVIALTKCDALGGAAGPAGGATAASTDAAGATAAGAIAAGATAASTIAAGATATGATAAGATAAGATAVGATAVGATAAGADAEMIDIARSDVRELVAGSFLEDAPIVEVSARTGYGLDALRDALVRVAGSAPARDVDGPMRLPIDRVFSMKGFGAVITGTLVSGCLRVDDEVDLLPAGRRVRVRGLQVHGERVREADSGQRVAANLDDVDTADITRGDVLVTPDAFALTNAADVTLELLADAKPLTHGARVRVHHGTREALARLGIVDTTIAPGTRAHARLRLETPMVMTRGDRFVLRAYSPVITIGGGYVLDPHPPRSALRTPAARDRFDALDTTSPDRAALVMLEERGREGLPIAALTSRLGLRGRAVDEIVRRLAPLEGAKSGEAAVSSSATEALGARGAAHAVRVGDLLLSRTVLDRLAIALIERVRRHHDAQPDSEGLPREEARDQLGITARVFEYLLHELSAAGTLTVRERLALPAHRVAVPDADAAVLARVEEAVLASGLKAHDQGELAAALTLPLATLERLVGLLVRQKRLVKLGTLVFHPGVLARLREETRALKASAAAGRAIVNVASFKTRYDVSRKYAIPLLEYLDRERVTRRVGDERVVL